MDKDGLASFFLGLGIGVGLGLLFAPKSGEETRDILLSKADEGREYLKKQTAGLRDSAGDIIDKSRDVISKQTSDLIDKSRDIIGKQKDNLSDAIAAGKQAYREKVETAPGGLA